MDDKFITALVSVALAITGLAIISVLVSQNAQTGGVLSASGKALSNAISCATSPITGAGQCGTTVSSTISFG